MRVLMTVLSDVVRDARVLREARTLQTAGHDVTVFGLRPPDTAEAPPLPTDLDVRWIGGESPFPRGRTGPRRGRGLYRAARWAMLPTHIRALERSFHRAVLTATEPLSVDVVHAHDFDTLELGAQVARRAGAQLVYDSHEAWLRRRRPGRSTPVADLGAARRERRLGGRAHAVITVSPSLAAWLERRYGWSHVTVVRNTFPLRADLDQVPLPSSPTGMVYAGRIGRGRDIETALAAAPELPELELVLVGPSDPSFLRPTAGVTLHDPVPVDDVDGLLRAAGLAIVSVADGPLNHRVALPNKLFQAVRAGVPVIASDLPELRRVVTGHDIGTLFRPGDAASFVRAAKEATARYDELARNVLTAQSQLSWAVDGAALVDLYARLRGA